MPTASISKAALGLLIASTLCSVQAHTASPRSAAECVYMPPKIFCYGGVYGESSETAIPTSVASDIFNSLDMAHDRSVGDVQNSWNQEQQADPGPNEFFGMTAVPDKDSIVMDGGRGDYQYGGPNFSSRYNTTVYSTNENKWTLDVPTGHPAVSFHSVVTGPDNIVYVFGGIHYPPGYVPYQTPVEYPMEMYIFDVQSELWSTGTAVQSLRDSRSDHKGVLGKDGKSIYYIGGRYPDADTTATTNTNQLGAAMDQIPVYDTSSGQWNTAATKGPTPSPRFGHTATAKPDTGEIIVFGGVSPVDALFLEDYFYILDTETMTWRNTTIGAEDGANYTVTMIVDHSAVLVENILYILFGQLPDYSHSSDVRPLDTDNWSWVSSVPAVQNSGTSGSGTSTGTIVGATVGSVGGVAIIGVVVFFFCWRKRRQSKKKHEDNGVPLDTSGEKYEVEIPVESPHANIHYSQAHPVPQSPNSFGTEFAHQDTAHYYHGSQNPNVGGSGGNKIVQHHIPPVQSVNNPDTRC